MEPKPCRQCGRNIVRRIPSEVARAVFCDNACKWAFQKVHPARDLGRRQTRACDICGQEFSYYPAVRTNARYCSKRCFGIGHSVTMTGRRPSGGVYTSANTFRTMARQSFLDRCALCGWDEAPCDVCHIVARKEGGDDRLENVIMLCPNHHRLFDRGRIPVEEVLAARQNCLRNGGAGEVS